MNGTRFLGWAVSPLLLSAVCATEIDSVLNKVRTRVPLDLIELPGGGSESGSGGTWAGNPGTGSIDFSRFPNSFTFDTSLPSVPGSFVFLDGSANAADQVRIIRFSKNSTDVLVQLNERTLRPAADAAAKGPVISTVEAVLERLMSVRRLANGEIELQAAGNAANRYAVEFSTDLQTWNEVGTAANELGALSFHASTAGQPHGYYRIKRLD